MLGILVESLGCIVVNRITLHSYTPNVMNELIPTVAKLCNLIDIDAESKQTGTSL